MSDTAIRVEGLSKRYRLGERVPYRALGEILTGATTATLRRLAPWGHHQSPPSSIANVSDDKQFWALRDVSFELKRGEVLGIIGRNGAGKSTLLKLLSRITEPTIGYAEIHGRVGSLLEVGSGFHPELTGRENVYLNGIILGMKKREIDRKFDEIVDFAEIDQFIDTPVKHYSSGMYTRLGFAVAAHLEPEILIVDEVLAVGDLQFQKKCLGQMGKVAKAGRTVLFVSHNMAAISTLCSTGLVLDSGKVIATGDLEHCVGAYIGHPTQGQDSLWVRPPDGAEGSLVIQRISSTVRGKQPHLALELEIHLESRAKHKPAFLAVDILDKNGVALMQALPRLEGFIEPSQRHHIITVTIQLPPLIPWQYRATVWVGSHNSETLDEVNEAITFETHESPTQGRSYPHTSSHGYIVPFSTVTVGEEKRVGASPFDSGWEN